MRYFIQFSYQGTDYHGWQIQPNAITVQEVMEQVIQTILREKVAITAAGRTDTGVHASEMFAHFDYRPILPANFIRKLNKLLPNSIAIHSIKKVKQDAHARFDALDRTYQYHITYTKNPFIEHTSWLFGDRKLLVEKMNTAALELFNYNDFTSFSKLHTDVKTNNCIIKKAFWKETPTGLVFTIQADRFLRNMVRAIVGSLLEVGLGKWSVEDFKSVIEEKNRQKAGRSVPAQGLFLTKITYPETIWNEN